MVKVSPLTLGTVQFGIPYGLRDGVQATTQQEVNAALNCAYEHGITSLDTAAAYGDSEEKIGKWIGERDITVTTKVHSLDVSSEAALTNSMRDRIDASRQRLHMSCIPIVMVHHFDEYVAHRAWFDKAFATMKAEGRIMCSGVSAYSTDDYFQIGDSGLDTVQIPVNILDWHQIDSGGLKALKDSGMLVFARSIYLQGLLLRTPETLPSRMRFAEGTLRKYIDLCDQYNLTQRELALSFVRTLPEIDSIVIGCRDIEQVKGNIETYKKSRDLTAQELQKIRSVFADTDRQILLPTLWPKEKE